MESSGCLQVGLGRRARGVCKLLWQEGGVYIYIVHTYMLVNCVCVIVCVCVCLRGGVFQFYLNLRAGLREGQIRKLHQSPSLLTDRQFVKQMDVHSIISQEHIPISPETHQAQGIIISDISMGLSAQDPFASNSISANRNTLCCMGVA